MTDTATTIYVDFEHGDDSGDGTRAHPLRTREAARERGATEIQVAIHAHRGVLWDLEPEDP